MKKTFIATALLGTALLVSAQSSFTVSLDGPQAGIASPGTGSGTLTLNLDSTVSYDIVFSGLIGTTTVAHIHGPAVPGVPAGVVRGLTFLSGLGATSGQLQGVTSALTPTEVSDMLANLHYVNIHSSFAGGGEIRGQVLLVPEPASLSLAAFGAVALILARRKGR